MSPEASAVDAMREAWEAEYRERSRLRAALVLASAADRAHGNTHTDDEHARTDMRRIIRAALASTEAPCHLCGEPRNTVGLTVCSAGHAPAPVPPVERAGTTNENQIDGGLVVAAPGVPEEEEG